MRSMYRTARPGLRVVVAANGLLALVALPSSCFRFNERTTQVASRAYIEFSGATAGATFSLERDGSPVVPPQSIGSERFQVPPGAYVLRIDRGSATVIRRRVLLTDGETLQIEVP